MFHGEIKHKDVLIDYLLTGVANGHSYFKTQQIADDLGLNPREVGRSIGRLKNKVDSLSIEVWARPHNVTWRVQLKK